MKATLTFDLEIPEDRAHHLRCTKALDLTLCLNQLNTELLAIFKYNELTEEQHAAYFEVKKLLDETLEEYGINLEELNR
jgi:hypothetical protein